MAVTHKLTFSSTRGSEVITKEISKSVGAEHVIDEAIPANQTDLLLALGIDVSQLKTLFILASVAMTLETNAVDATGGNTLDLEPNEPLVWFEGCGWACPLTLDVTALYVTNTTAGQLQIRVGYDPTV